VLFESILVVISYFDNDLYGVCYQSAYVAEEKPKLLFIYMPFALEYIYDLLPLSLNIMDFVMSYVKLY